MFPADNPWNTRVDSLPVASNSDAIIATIGAATGLHPDFGSGKWAGGPIGIPYDVVDGTKIKRWTKLKFQYADESDPGPYPIPKKVHIEHGSDRHALIVDTGTCKLYELFALEGQEGRLRRDLEPELERAAAGRLDVGRRCRAPHPSRAGPLRRGRRGLDRPRASLHRPAHSQGTRLAGPARRELADRSELAADGAAASG